MRAELLLAFAVVGSATLAGALKCIYCGPAGSGIPSCDGGNTTTKTCAVNFRNPACVSAYDRKGGKLLYGDCTDTAQSRCFDVPSNNSQGIGTYQCACKIDLCNGSKNASTLSSRSLVLLVFSCFVGSLFVRF